jgi:carbonic anhydrase
MPKDLLDGLRHFRDTDMARYRELYERLCEEGQRPGVLFVACSDSRIVPSLLTGTGPGDLFIVRTIGNIVAPPDTAMPDATAAAVEFSVATLGVREVVVCGHSRCGAMKALYEGVPDGLAHLEAWVEHARPAELERDRVERCRDVEQRDELTAQRNVLLSLDRLAAHPLVAERRASKELILHGWYYDIATGDVRVFDPGSRSFEAPETLLT